MKTRGLFLSALMMSAVLAGCSNEDGALENIQPKEVAKSDSYIAVNIVAPGVDSRATDGGFEVGSEVENAVTSALFVFFDENGGFVQAVDADSDDLNPWSDGEGSVDKISSATIVLNNPKSAPKQVVALLNSGLTSTTYGTKNLAELKALTGEYSSTQAFTMSNSVYQDADGNEVMTAALTDANVQKSEDLAKQNPVTITVERTLAKVTASVAEPLAVTGKDVELDGTEVTLVPEITGFKVVATNPVSYLVKNIEDYDFDWTWTEPANLRSYWATSATPEEYTYFSYDDMLPIADYAEYCLENTSSTPTKLLVSATIKPEGAEEAQDILKYKGLYYTETGILTKANELLAAYYYPTTNANGEPVNSNDWAPYLEIVDAGTEAAPWEVKVALKEGAPEVAGVADAVAAMDTAAQWTEGKAYYYVDIEGLGGEAGIVRNHFHKLTISSVTGIGTPVYNPSEEIIPQEMPEEEYFVAAKVQILKWKIVGQSVALGQ